MATRTISPVGGNWSATTAWVEAAVPTAADDVVALATSGNLTIDVAAACRSIDMTGYTNTLSQGFNITLSIGDASGGALKFVAGMTYAISTNSSKLLFVSTSTNGGAGWSVTFGGKTVGDVSFQGSGGKWVLQDTLNSTGSTFNLVQVAAGTLVTNDHAINCGQFNFTGGTVTLGSSALTLTGTSFSWTASGVTFTANTATVTASGTGITFSAGGIDYNGLSVVFSSAGTQTLLGTGWTFGNLTRTGTAAAGCQLTLGGNGTVTGLLTLTGANSTTQRLAVKSSVGGTNRTITANGTVSETNVDYTDIVKAGSATWPPGFRSFTTATGTTLSAAVSTPAGVVAGDLLVLFVEWTDPNNHPDATITPPAGFTYQGGTGTDYDNNNSGLMSVYTKVADGTEGATLTSSFVTAFFVNTWTLYCLAFQGVAVPVAVTNAVIAGAGGGTGTSLVLPSITMPAAGGLIALCVNAGGSPSLPAGMTSIAVTTGFRVAYEVRASGATGTRTSTFAASGGDTSLLLGLAPPPVYPRPVMRHLDAVQRASRY